MDNLWYLIRVSVCVCMFYGLYIAFFRNMTLFIANRIYLLTSLLLSFVIPGSNVHFVSTDYHVAATDFISRASLQTYELTTKSIMASPNAMNFSVLSAIYWVGFAFFTFRLLYFINGIIKLKNCSEMSKSGKIRTVHAVIDQPFSFFNLVFLPKHGVNSLVLEHEKAHVYQRHWIDLILMEIAATVLWFNPIMILYRKSIKIQHEYEADSCALRGSDVEHYFECMLRHLQTENDIKPISRFYSQTIKNRIIMMTRKKTNLKFSMLYALAIPMICSLLFAFSNPSIRTMATNELAGKDGQVVVVVDAGHGGQDLGSEASDGMNEKDLVLTMAKHIQKAGEAKHIKVVLTRSGNEALTLEERILITNRHEANAFISLHANYDEENAASAGIECLVSEKNSLFQESKRLAERLVYELKTLEGISVNGTRESDPYVLSKNSVPAIVLELGYLSNESDHAYLSNERNQKQISEKIINAVVQYTK